MTITDICFNCRQDEFYRSSMTSPAGSLVLYILKSPVVFCIEDAYTRKPGNSFILIDENTSYSIFSEGDIFIYDRIIFKTDGKSDSLIPFNLRTGSLYKITSHNKTDYLINMILNEYYSLSTHKNELLKQFISSLFLELSNEVKNDSPAADSPYYDKLLEIRRNIHSKPSEKWTVDLICRQVNLSRSYFQLLYRETFGITCINDVIESKINLAKRLLESTQDTIAIIAQSCGYDSDVHFMRQFKKITGLTPSEYRKKITRGK